MIEKHFGWGIFFVGLCYLIGKFGGEFTGGIDHYRILDGFQYILYFWAGFCLRKYGLRYLMKIPTIIYLALNIGTIFLNKLLTDMELPHMLGIIRNLFIPALVMLVGGMMAFVTLQKLFIKF